METVEAIEPLTVVNIDTEHPASLMAFMEAVQRDPIAALVKIQSKNDRVETFALRELVASVVGVPADNITEMVQAYKKHASQAGWSASTLKVRASNLKGVLECARLNSGYADLVAMQESCGLQRAYAMRAEFLKKLNSVDGEGSAEGSDNGADDGADEDTLTVNITAEGAYVKALAQAIVCAEVLKRSDDIALLRELMTQVSQSVSE